MLELEILAYCGFALILFIVIGIIKIALDINEFSFYIFVLIIEIALIALSSLLYQSLILNRII